MDAQKEAYKIEAYELLSELETSLLELEAAPDNMDLVARVFRAMHTIKGSGAMFGFEAIAEFTHDVETVFDLVREGKIPVSTHLVNLALGARDHIKSMLDHDDDPKAVNQDEQRALLTDFRAVLATCPGKEDGEKGTASDTVEGSPPAENHTADKESMYRIRFTPHANLFQNGTNPLTLLSEIAAMGECRVAADLGQLPEPAFFDPELCYMSWDIVLTTLQSTQAIQDIFIFVEDDCDLNIELLDTVEVLIDQPNYKPLGEILIERGEIDTEILQTALGKQKRLGEILIQDNLISSQKVNTALSEQEFVRNIGASRDSKAAPKSLRVSAEKLDILVDLVGELVTVQARLSQKAASDHNPELLSISETVERLTAELRDNTLSIRMVPIDVTFNKLRRLVRDLSNDLGKRILLKTEGNDTELDKTVIEQLNDPLVHILRNSIDHGIEPPDQRQSAGKHEQGQIVLRAEHSGANVLIHISDDGAGIDTDKIRRKAIEKGLISPEAEKSEKELHQLIFHPGFSTAGAVTSISGRGVGMDVVKRSIEALRGAVDISSRKGRGTTITLRLPLTLAIIDGLLVEIDTDKYVLPLSSIEECVELTREDIAKTHGRNILNIRDKIIPFIPLRHHFAIPGTPPAIEQVVINAVDGQRVGIVVDRVIGEHQIVIKTMNALYKNVQEISGATILGDGTVALILDVPKLLNELKTTQLAA